MAFVAMIVIVIVRRRGNFWADIAELGRRALEFKTETAEFDMSGLLRQHDFKELEIFGLPIEPLDDCRNKNGRAVGRRNRIIQPADILLDQQPDVLNLNAALAEAPAVELQHVADRRELDSP